MPKVGALYSDAVKTINKKTATSDIFIKHIGPGKVEQNVVIKYIHSAVNPAALNVKYDSTKTLKNRLVVKCADANSCNVLLDNLKTALGRNYAIENPRKLKPRLIIKSVNANLLEAVSVEEIIDDTITLNNLGDVSKDTDIKLINNNNKLKSGETLYNVIIETSVPYVRQ